MYLFLKPLVITKIYQERVNNYGVSNEYIKMNVITGGQNFFINETGLFTNGNRKFDEEWKNNEKLESYSGELVIYNRDKIKPEDLIEQQVKLESIGSIQDMDFENSLYFQVFLDNDSFTNLNNEFHDDKHIESIQLQFSKDPKDNPDNHVGYKDTFSEYTPRNIQWTIKDKSIHNYLSISEIVFQFERMNVEDDFYSFDTKEEREETRIHNENYKLQKMIESSIDSSRLTSQIKELKDEIFEKFKVHLSIITFCVVTITLKIVFGN